MPERRLQDYHYEKGRFIPRYELLKRLLLDEFSTMPPEQEFLPTQEELAKRYELSRNTVRRALAKLQRDGYIQTSTKTGSRILKRAVEARRPVDSKPQTGSCIALLLTNNCDDNLCREDIRWQLVDEIERTFQAHGIRLVVYNLRENQWRTWNDLSQLLRSLRGNGIRWAAMRPNRNTLYPWQDLLEALQKEKIALTLYMQDTEEVMQFADFFRPGTGFTVVNNHTALLEALHHLADGAEHLVYTANESAAFFADSRAQTCADFARTRNLPFDYLKSDFFIRPDNSGDLSGFVNSKTARTLLKRTARRSRILCVCANDETAVSLRSRLRRMNADLKKFRFLGCDNNGLSEAEGFSSIDFDSRARAIALYELYQDFLEGVTGRCSMTFSRPVLRQIKSFI